MSPSEIKSEKEIMGKVKKITIVHKNHDLEVHNVDSSDKRGCGITAIGYSFYSETIRDFVLIHPSSVEKLIIHEEE